jgi:hypothetical protein
MFNNLGQGWKRDRESKVKYELDNTFEVQGVIKPGADLKTVNGNSKRRGKKFGKESYGCSVERHRGCRRKLD